MRWVEKRSIELMCPVCDERGTKPVRLEVESPFPGRGLRELVDWVACGSQFFADQLLPPEEYERTIARP